MNTSQMIHNTEDYVIWITVLNADSYEKNARISTYSQCMFLNPKELVFSSEKSL